jgi:hypothetical protein
MVVCFVVMLIRTNCVISVGEQALVPDTTADSHMPRAKKHKVCGDNSTATVPQEEPTQPSLTKILPKLQQLETKVGRMGALKGVLRDFLDLGSGSNISQTINETFIFGGVLNKAKLCISVIPWYHQCSSNDTSDGGCGMMVTAFWRKRSIYGWCVVCHMCVGVCERER